MNTAVLCQPDSQGRIPHCCIDNLLLLRTQEVYDNDNDDDVDDDDDDDDDNSNLLHAGVLSWSGSSLAAI